MAIPAARFRLFTTKLHHVKHHIRQGTGGLACILERPGPLRGSSSHLPGGGPLPASILPLFPGPLLATPVQPASSQPRVVGRLRHCRRRSRPTDPVCATFNPMALREAPHPTRLPCGVFYRISLAPSKRQRQSLDPPPLSSTPPSSVSIESMPPVMHTHV